MEIFWPLGVAAVRSSIGGGMVCCVDTFYLRSIKCRYQMNEHDNLFAFIYQYQQLVSVVHHDVGLPEIWIDRPSVICGQ